MSEIRVAIVRWVSDDPQPGWVECRMTDAWGQEWSFEDKPYIFTCLDLSASGDYPQPGTIGCEIVSHWRDPNGREIVTIDTERPCHVESTTGQTRFDVLPEQLLDDG